MTLAATLHAALADSKTPFQVAAPAPAQPAAAQIDLDTAAVDQTLGARGAVNGGVYQSNIPRAEAITDDGMAVPSSMGTAVAIDTSATTIWQAARAKDLGGAGVATVRSARGLGSARKLAASSSSRWYKRISRHIFQHLQKEGQQS